MASSALRDAFDSLASRSVILFGGKGGVGKTTISSIAALHFAKTRPTILFTTDPASNLGDLFDQPVANLTIEQLDANALYQRFLGRNLESFLEIGDRGTYLAREELQRFFELSIPGVDELMAWSRMSELAEEHPESLIVVDTAPTGHTVRMLSAAEHFRRFGLALDALQEKRRGMMRQFTRRDVRDTMDNFIEDFEAQANHRRELLRDAAKTGFVPVFLAEPWVVEQTRRLAGEVREEGIDIPFAVLNRAAPDDCPLCQKRKERDAGARIALGGIRVVDAARSCVPLDTVERLDRYPDAARASSGPAVPTRRAEALPASTAKLLFVAGKGGVGKTTIATSIALQRASANPTQRYTIISVDPAHALRDVFAKEKPPPNLNVETVDTRAAWSAFRDRLGAEIEAAMNALTPGGMSLTYDIDALDKLMEISPPGADELFAVTRLADLLADESQAMVIVDTAPTGHFLRLLDLPKTAGEWVRELMRILLRYREVVPAGALGEELIAASRSLHRLEEALHAEEAAVIVVCRPERIVIAETRRLIDELKRRDIVLDGVIANYVTPDSSCPCDRSMRAHEEQALQDLGLTPVIIPRRYAPVTRLDEIAGLTSATSS